MLVERWVGVGYIIARVNGQQTVRSKGVSVCGRVSQKQVSFSKKF